MIIEVSTKVSGRFRVGVILPSGAYEERAAWFDNLIVDTGLDLLGTNTATQATQYCEAGTGATAPSNSQTGLVSPLGVRSGAGTSVITTSGGSPVWYQSMTRVYTFAIGAVVGNVAELGTFTATTGGAMFSRALIRDGGGSPTTITVLADEQLVVTYELRKYPPAADATGTVSITVDGALTTYDYTVRAANVGGTSSDAYWRASNGFAGTGVVTTHAIETQTLGAVTTIPVGTAVLNSSGSVLGYTAGNFYRDITPAWSIGVANFATGIGSVVFGNFGSASSVAGWQMSFSPKLPKDATKTLSLTLRLSWGRYAA